MEPVFARAHAMTSKALDPIQQLSILLAALCLIVLAVVVSLQIVARFFDVPVVWASDVAGYSLVATTFLALAPTLRHGVHIRVNLVLQHVPLRARFWLEAWSFAVGLIFASYAAWWCIVQVIDSYRFGDVSTGLVPFPLWMPQTFMAVGCSTFALAMLEGLFAVLAGREPFVEAEQAADPDLPSDPGTGEVQPDLPQPARRFAAE